MNNFKDLITAVFNIDDSRIESFKSEITKSEDGEELVCFYIKFQKQSGLVCPVCGQQLTSNGSKKKPVNHQVLTNRHVKLIYDARRYRCYHCGHSEFEKNPFSLPGFSVSILTMDNIMRDLHNPRYNYTMIAQKYHISVTQVITYLDSFVVVPMLDLPENMGIDEIHSNMAKRRNAKYLGVIIDNDHFNLIDILPSRNKTDLNNFFQNYSKEARDKVKYVTIDMWEPYKDVATHWLKSATIAVDPFHVVEHLMNDFRKIRVRIMKQCPYGSNGYYLLKSWHKLLESDDYNWDGEGQYNHVLHKKLNYGQLRDLALEVSDELRLAYNLKEMYRRFNKKCTYDNAEKELDILIKAFQLSNIPEYKEFYDLLIHWKQEIINSFIIAEATDNRLSNAKTESMNNLLKDYIKVSNGLANFRRFRKRMLFCFNDRVYYAITAKLSSLKRDFKNSQSK